MEPLSPSLHPPRSDSKPYPERSTPRRALAHRPAAEHSPRTSTISLQALTQRLSLVAAIELPCTVQLGSRCLDRDGAGRLRSCARTGGCFQLSGDHFSLRLSEAYIDSVRLTASPPGDNAETGIEILSSNGQVVARIQGPPDRARAAVWQDIMDTFDWT